MIDLHTHSTASDGHFTPSELVDYAFKKNIKVLAVTDHDTTKGLKEACIQAQKINSTGDTGIIVVPGIELSIEWPTGEFHLLGLGLKTLSKSLEEITTFLENERINRNKKMIERLNEQDINITYDDIYNRFGNSNIGRPHFAELLVEKGYVKQRQQAFDRYFAKGRPCYVERLGADLEQACKAIKDSGGIPVQAHPLSMYVSWGKIDSVMEGIISKGIMGLEAWHPGVRVSEAERLEVMAQKNNLIATAGSDFHGERVRADRHIGYSAGKRKIEDRFWDENLKPALEKFHGNSDLSFE